MVCRTKPTQSCPDFNRHPLLCATGWRNSLYTKQRQRPRVVSGSAAGRSRKERILSSYESFIQWHLLLQPDIQRQNHWQKNERTAIVSYRKTINGSWGKVGAFACHKPPCRSQKYPMQKNI